MTRGNLHGITVAVMACDAIQVADHNILPVPTMRIGVHHLSISDSANRRSNWSREVYAIVMTSSFLDRMFARAEITGHPWAHNGIDEGHA